MSDLNQCNFIGRLGADPELRFTQSNKAVANVSLAVNRKTKDSESVEWVPLVFFERQAEVAGEYLRKGSRIFVSGRFQTRKWTDRDGNDRWTTEIIVGQFQMLDSKPEGQQPTRGQQPPARPTDGPGDDIPF